jgi:hypothetical protein
MLIPPHGQADETQVAHGLPYSRTWKRGIQFTFPDAAGTTQRQPQSVSGFVHLSVHWGIGFESTFRVPLA